MLNDFTEEDIMAMQDKIRGYKQEVTALIESREYSREETLLLIQVNSKLSEIIAMLERPNNKVACLYRRAKKDFKNFIKEFKGENK